MDELILKRTEQDTSGVTHKTYQHNLNGILVENSQLIIHSGENSPYVRLFTNMLTTNVNTQRAVFTENMALTRAVQSAGTRKFAWLDSLSEKEIKEESKNSLTTNYPKGQLIYARAQSKAQLAVNYKLCYRFAIRAVAPDYASEIFIDARTGTVFKEINLLQSCDHAAATATTLYNGNQTISTDYNGWPWNRYVLDDCERNIHTKYGSGSNPDAANDNTTWGTNNQAATSGHWAAEMTWDLFKWVYGRDGCDGNGREIKLLVDHPGQDNNAQYDLNGGNDKIKVGRTTTGDRSMATLDVIGHELTHGVTKSTCNLGTTGEPGALNESFSDIFGFMVERRAQAGIFDWRQGEDAFVETNGRRDMQDPNTFNHPKQVNGTHWTSSFDDVYVNAGITNRWFYLLSTGDSQNGVTVTGIGIDDAASITWRMLLYYLFENAGFNDARSGSINAAIALFGECSDQVLQVQNAWAAVGVGAPGNANCITLYPSMVSVCYDPPNVSESGFPFTITAGIRPANGTIDWSMLATDFSYTVSGNTITVTDGPRGPGLQMIIPITVTSSSGTPATTNLFYESRYCSSGGGGTEMRQVQQVQSTNIGKVLEFNCNKPYPNPADTKISLNLKHSSSIEIYDQNGRVLLLKKVNAGLSQINTKNFASGMYLLKVSENKVVSTIHKIIIQH